jgi:simple sugar transport system ATP-binding protein
MAPFLEMRNIVKRFPGVVANDHVNLTIETGEVHALLGENGAGKSTLMQILYGLYKRDAGEILLQGQPIEIREPRDAIAAGIGMIHQDFMLIKPFTVAENIIVGLEDEAGPLLDLRAAAHRLTELSKRHGLDVDPSIRIENLSVGVQQRVEILKLLYRNARLLILDEPTAVLIPQEVESLFEVIRSLRDKGHSIVFITHKLQEVITVADRVTILRDGKAIATLKTAETNPTELARMMVGREVLFSVSKTARKPGRPFLKVENLHVTDNAGHPKVQGLNLEICEGEILGLAGVDGNGQSELAEALMNLRTASGGRVLLNGQDITRATTATRRFANMAYIPSDRRQVGSVGPLSIAYNSILGEVAKYSRAHFLLDEHRIRAHAEDLVKRYDIRVAGIRLEASKLSGGNLQKLVLARELSRKPDVLIVEQPTRGLDVGATEYIHAQLIHERDRGAAILLISAELEEILMLSDRIAVIYRGKIMNVMVAGSVDITELGLMMAGIRTDHPRNVVDNAE